MKTCLKRVKNIRLRQTVTQSETDTGVYRLRTKHPVFNNGVDGTTFRVFKFKRLSLCIGKLSGIWNFSINSWQAWASKCPTLSRYANDSGSIWKIISSGSIWKTIPLVRWSELVWSEVFDMQRFLYLYCWNTQFDFSWVVWRLVSVCAPAYGSLVRRLQTFVVKFQSPFLCVLTRVVVFSYLKKIYSCHFEPFS